MLKNGPINEGAANASPSEPENDTQPKAKNDTHDDSSAGVETDPGNGSEESREEATSKMVEEMTSPLEAPPDGESLADVDEDDVRIADPSEGDDQADAAWAEVTNGDTTAQELLDDLHDEVGDDDMGGVEADHDDAPAPEEPQNTGEKPLEPIEAPKLRPIEATHVAPIPGDAPSRGEERRLAEIGQKLVTPTTRAVLPASASDPPKYHKPPPERRRLKPPPSPRNQGRGGHDFKMTRGR